MLFGLKHVATYLLLGNNSISHFDNVYLNLFQGDITKWRGGALVNAANEQCLGGGGVDGAVHKASGPKLKEFCNKLPIVKTYERGGYLTNVRCPTGDAKITLPGDLSNQIDYIIHTVGPIYVNDEISAPILESSYISSLERGEEKNITSIAFPAVSCGIYGYPTEKASLIAIGSVQKFFQNKDESIANMPPPTESLDSSCTFNYRSNYKNIDFVLYTKGTVDAWGKAADYLKLQKLDTDQFHED